MARKKILKKEVILDEPIIEPMVETVIESVSEIETSFNEPVVRAREIDFKRLLIIFLSILVILGASGSFHFYKKYKALTIDANIEIKKETDRLVGILGKLIELPVGETPTVATISDKEKLKNQPFFVQAENGDILFAYTTAMKAILYRPSSNKIINVAPININQTSDVSQGVKKTAPATTETP